MGQLGSCLKRLIVMMEDNYDPAHPFKFFRWDIKDGFWRLIVSEQDAWGFYYVLPSADGKEVKLNDVEIVVPDAPQMGWCDSPPIFGAGSETAQDTIQELADNEVALPPHKFGKRMNPVQTIPTGPTNPTTFFEVFVNDFLNGTNDLSTPSLLHKSQCMLHGVHSISPPIEITEHGGADAIAETKLEQGKGSWEYIKEILS